MKKISCRRERILSGTLEYRNGKALWNITKFRSAFLAHFSIYLFMTNLLIIKTVRLV